MATTLSGTKMGANFQANLTSGAAPATASANIAHSASVAPAVGSSAGQSDKAYSLPISVTSGSPLTINLQSLTDPLGGTVNLAHVTGIMLTNDGTAGGGDLTIHSASSTLFGADAPPVQAGGFLALSAPNPGYATASTNNFILTASAGTVAGKLTIFGRSA